MSVERIIHCDGAPHSDPGGTEEGCQVHERTLNPDPYVPPGWVRCVQGEPNRMTSERILHFCGWSCVMRYAATVPAPVFVSAEDFMPGEDD